MSSIVNILRRLSTRVVPSSVSLSGVSVVKLQLARGAQREQRDKDKENMKKKKEKRDKAAEAKKKGGSVQNSSLGEEYGINLMDMEGKMSEQLEFLRSNFSQVKAGRVVPTQLDSIPVKAAGQTVPLKALGSISARGAQVLVVQLYDMNVAKEVDRAVRDYDPELNVKVEEQAVIITFPKVTREVRDQLIKQIHKKAEDVKGHVRAVRQKYLNQLKSAKVPEDVNKELKDQIQQGTDRATAQIEMAVKEKVEEINQV